MDNAPLEGGILAEYLWGYGRGRYFLSSTTSEMSSIPERQNFGNRIYWDFDVLRKSNEFPHKFGK